jgi:Sigma-54 interaction domain
LFVFLLEVFMTDPVQILHLEELDNGHFFLAACPTMLRLYRDIRVLAPVDIPVLILAANNINMEAAIADKRFREDVYYRLNTLTITIPPLRERREEIPFLMQQLIQRELVGTWMSNYFFRPDHGSGAGIPLARESSRAAQLRHSHTYSAGPGSRLQRPAH